MGRVTGKKIITVPANKCLPLSPGICFKAAE